MRNALVVGINCYDNNSRLYGCVSDAQAVQRVLSHHSDGLINFDVKSLVGSQSGEVTRAQLKDELQLLFSASGQTALFYFAGHGHIEATGGYLLASDARRGDEGLALSDVLALANRSPAHNKIIVLDSCHSGIAGTRPAAAPLTELAEGVTILTASTADQYASEVNGAGAFTTLFVNALDGAAANLVGDITPGSVYAHVDQSLGWWQQRPVFKTNVKNFVSLRRVQAPLPVTELRRLTELFPTPDFVFRLDPTFEAEMRGRSAGMPSPITANTLRFAILQRYARVNLVTPVDAPHLWHAAMGSTGCRLTTLGEHYRKLVEANRI